MNLIIVNAREYFCRQIITVYREKHKMFIVVEIQMGFDKERERERERGKKFY